MRNDNSELRTFLLLTSLACPASHASLARASRSSRAISNLSFPSGGGEKASRLDVFQFDEIPKNLELRITGEQRGVSGYGKRCGETIGIGHGVLGL